VIERRAAAGPCDAQRRVGGSLAAALRLAEHEIRTGATVSQLSATVSRAIAELGGEPVFREAGGFENVVILVNGIRIDANSQQRLGRQDLVTIDAGCRCDGWCADAGRTWRVTDNGIGNDLLLVRARQALQRSIEKLGQDGNWSEAVEVSRGWIRGLGKEYRAELTGHGVGRELHEDPVLTGESAVRVARSGRGLAVELSVWRETGRAGEESRRTECMQFEETIWLEPAGGEILTGDGTCEVGLDRGNGVQSLAPLGVGCL
jgi:methionine aminopeptidase